MGAASCIILGDVPSSSSGVACPRPLLLQTRPHSGTATSRVGSGFCRPLQSEGTHRLRPSPQLLSLRAFLWLHDGPLGSQRQDHCCGTHHPVSEKNAHRRRDPGNAGVSCVVWRFSSRGSPGSCSHATSGIASGGVGPSEGGAEGSGFCLSADPTVEGGGGGTPTTGLRQRQQEHQQEHRPQRPTERSDPTQHAKGGPGDSP